MVEKSVFVWYLCNTLSPSHFEVEALKFEPAERRAGLSNTFEVYWTDFRHVPI